MIKKILSMLVIAGMVFFVQCADDPIDPVQSTLKAGGNGGGGGGGHTETAGNNLSFPAFLLDGYSVTEVLTDQFTVVYSGDYEGLTDEQIAYCLANGPWYPQKTEGNVWQADYVYADNISVNWIDWGDAIEAVDPKIRRPYRLELVLFVSDLAAPMEAFTMAELEYPSSKNELQGTNMNTYDCYVASVASPYGKIVVQEITGADPTTLVWNGTSWTGGGAITPVSFAVENNVGGKLIFGASTGGWKPTALGDYRITFYVEGGNVDLSGALIGNYNGDGATFTQVVQAENNTDRKSVV